MEWGFHRRHLVMASCGYGRITLADGIEGNKSPRLETSIGAKRESLLAARKPLSFKP
jgi:hypothetical protein